MVKPKYQSVQNYLKEKIQQGEYVAGDYLPSENELCHQFKITRTTARKSLDELLKEGFIEKLKGKGSRVIERRKSLGLLSVKGFSEAVGKNVQTIFLEKPHRSKWNGEIFSGISESDKSNECLSFERLRYVGEIPAMLGKNWFSSSALPGFLELEFVNHSFFKTLSEKYLIEVIGSSSELRAESANKRVAELLKIKKDAPILHISIKFTTSNSKLNIYSELYCNTSNYPIGNSYFL